MPASRMRTQPFVMDKEFLDQCRVEPNGCVTWTGVTQDGRPIANHIQGRPVAYRAAWEHAHGELIGSRKLRRTCNNPLCVRPSHYEFPGPRLVVHNHYPDSPEIAALLKDYLEDTE